MRISVFGGDVEDKFARILNDLVTKFHINSCSFLIGLLQENRVQGRIKLFANILKQNRLSELNCILKSSQEVGIRQFNYIDFARHLHLFNPFVGLTLRINAKRPPSRFEYNDTIFQRKIVRRKAINVPLSHLNRVSQNMNKREIL